MLYYFVLALAERVSVSVQVEGGHMLPSGNPVCRNCGREEDSAAAGLEARCTKCGGRLMYPPAAKKPAAAAPQEPATGLWQVVCNFLFRRKKKG